MRLVSRTRALRGRIMTAEPAPRVQVVRLGEEQGDTVAALLGRAFQDDPLFAHACPDPTERARWLPWMFRWDAWRGFLSGEMLGTSGRLDGAAVAVRPGVGPFTDADLASFDYERGRQIVGPEIWDRAGAALTAALEPPEEALHIAVPEPRWYLDIIAVEPAAQGRGIGSALLHAVATLADADGVPIALLIDNPAPRDFYQRHGYKVVFEAPGPGEVRWQGMRRDPSRAP